MIPKKYLDQIINGDCITGIKKIPDNSIDLIIADQRFRFGAIDKTIIHSKYLRKKLRSLFRKLYL